MKNKTNNKNINITDKVYTNVYTTKDYEKFSFIQGNRPLNKTKYGQLLESMKQEHLMIPIIVNDKLQIIDGQHRWTASKELKLPLYYIINKEYGIEEVKRANLVSSTWTQADYLNLHISDGLQSYEYFNELLLSSRMLISDLLKVYAMASNINQDVMIYLFENGELKSDNIEKVKTFIEDLKDFDFYKGSRRRSFIAAFSMLYFDERYDHSIMKQRLKRRATELENTSNKSKIGYLSVLANDIYSFGANKNNLFYDEKRNRLYTL